MNLIYRIFVVVGLIIIADLAWWLAVNSDTYQQHHSKKLLGLYLSGTNKDLFLRQVITGEEPEFATFEVPVKYDQLKHPEYLSLLVDPADDDPHSGKGGEFQECDRATNGNCLLIWNTTFDPPGQHHLRAKLFCPGPRITKHWEFMGPALLFNSTNLLQFDPFYSSFDSNGMLLYAKVAKTNATYSIELKSTSGAHVKTITGSTTNGEIKEYWDLTDNRGNKVTNDSFNTVFNVTLIDGASNSVSETRAKKDR